MPINIYRNNAWKEIEQPKVRVSGVWKDVVKGYARVNGTWVVVYESSVDPIYYISMRDSSSKKYSLYKSTDSGSTWTNISGTTYANVICANKYGVLTSKGFMKRDEEGTFYSFPAIAGGTVTCVSAAGKPGTGRIVAVFKDDTTTGSINEYYYFFYTDDGLSWHACGSIPRVWSITGAQYVVYDSYSDRFVIVGSYTTTARVFYCSATDASCSMTQSNTTPGLNISSLTFGGITLLTPWSSGVSYCTSGGIVGSGEWSYSMLGATYQSPAVYYDSRFLIGVQTSDIYAIAKIYESTNNGVTWAASSKYTIPNNYDSTPYFYVAEGILFLSCYKYVYKWNGSGWTQFDSSYTALSGAACSC